MVKKFCTTALVALAAAAALASPALASHGGGGTSGGSGGGGGGGDGGGGGTTTPLPAPPIPPATFDGIGPGPVYIHDSFGAAQGTRLAQDGDVVDVTGRSEINGIRAEFPNNEAETWFSPDVSSSWGIFGGIGFSSFSDPFEPFSPLQVGQFGPADGDMSVSFDVDGGPARPDALLPFPAPADSASTVSADTSPSVGRTAIGFTSSSATSGNFESDGQAWLELQSPGITHSGVNTGTWTFHTDGLSGTTLSGTYVLGASSAVNRMAVSYDPVAHVAEATIDGTVVADVPYTAQTIKYVGVEGSGSGNVNNFTVRTGTATDTQ